MKLKTERNWFMKSAGVGRISQYTAFPRSLKVFSLSRTHPKQDPKKLQLDVILLHEGYQKQTQVSGHITWKLLSWRSKSPGINKRTGAALSHCRDI